jgi:hypothetical protein
MSSQTAQLLSEFDSLPVQEKQVFVKELFRRMPPIDSGGLSDDELAMAGDAMAAMLDEEERATKTR